MKTRKRYRYLEHPFPNPLDATEVQIARFFEVRKLAVRLGKILVKELKAAAKKKK